VVIGREKKRKEKINYTHTVGLEYQHDNNYTIDDRGENKVHLHLPPTHHTFVMETKNGPI
jgi:hypothetical protein